MLGIYIFFQENSGFNIATPCPNIQCKSECFPITNQRGCLECLCSAGERHNTKHTRPPSITLLINDTDPVNTDASFLNGSFPG